MSSTVKRLETDIAEAIGALTGATANLDKFLCGASEQTNASASIGELSESIANDAGFLYRVQDRQKQVKYHLQPGKPRLKRQLSKPKHASQNANGLLFRSQSPVTIPVEIKLCEDAGWTST